MADDGKPVAGAEVRLLIWKHGYDTKTATTNAEGQFEFKGLAEGKYTLAAYYQNLSSRGKRYQGYEVKAGEDSIVLKLHAAPSLKVKVVARGRQADPRGDRGARVDRRQAGRPPHRCQRRGAVQRTHARRLDDQNTREGFRGGQTSGEPQRNGDGQRDREAGAPAWNCSAWSAMRTARGCPRWRFP